MFFVRNVKYHIFRSSGHFSALKQWTTFQIADVDLDPESAKCDNSNIYCLSNVTSLSSLGIWNITRVTTLRPRQNGRHFADDIFKCIFLNENASIAIKISLKFVPNGPINNIPALVQIMAWRRPGDTPLSEPMMVRLPTHICVTRPQWVNTALTV